MSALWYIDDAGTAHPMLVGPRGPRGPQGPTVYEQWLDAGNTGTVEDFLASVAPDVVPSQVDVTVGASSTGTIPSNSSLVSVTVTGAVEVSIADVATERFGTNPDGWTFTLHLAGDLSLLAFAPGVHVYGSLGTATEAWASVVRRSGTWCVIVGVVA